MKDFALLSLLILTASCKEQVEIKKAWLPEEYVKAFVQNDTTAKSQLVFPIEAFVTYNDSIQILTYRGEISPISSNKLKEYYGDKELLQNVHYYFNQKYISKGLVIRYSKAKFLLSRQHDKLLLEIKEHDKIEKIYFVDRVPGYLFRDIRESKQFLMGLLSNNYKR
jgi:hypothetical protein